MEKAEEFNQYKKHLLTMLNSITATTALEEKNQVLIVYKLNTVEKIRKFFDWIGQNLKDNTLKATEVEIVRAAVQASKE